MHTNNPEQKSHKSGQQHLEQGLALHEQGEYEEALSHFNFAYRIFRESDQTEKVAEVLSACTLTLRRLEKLEEAVEALKEAVNLTEGTGGSIIPLYNLAKVQQQMEDSDSVDTFQHAIDAMVEHRPASYSPASLADMELHLANAQLQFSKDSGDAEARALSAIEALKNDEQLDDFHKMVWISGGYLRLAGYYSDKNPAQAWEYFDLAEKLIFDYPDEKVLRRQDLEVLREKMPERP